MSVTRAGGFTSISVAHSRHDMGSLSPMNPAGLQLLPPSTEISTRRRPAGPAHAAPRTWSFFGGLASGSCTREPSSGRVITDLTRTSSTGGDVSGSPPGAT